jgi:hypothetical protein
MIEFLSKFDSGEFIGLVAVAGAFLCGAPAVILGCWLEIRKVALKQYMLEQGMSAEEIRTVLYGGSGRSRKEVRSQQSCGA